jgi:16S rRNA (guanine966-N2)-methyltransferase
MRIIAGKMKGIVLNLPINKNTRPLKDMARESIFNILEHSNKIFFNIKNSRVLDLYAGTGSFGLECISRSAENVCFVEKEKNACAILEKNIEKLKAKNETKILSMDIFKLLEMNKTNLLDFNLIFCDPPFKSKSIEKLIKEIHKKKLLKRNGIIVIHREKNTSDNFPNYFEIIEERIYGISKIIFGKLLS